RRTRRHVSRFRGRLYQSRRHREHGRANGYGPRRHRHQPDRHHGSHHARVSENLYLEEIGTGPQPRHSLRPKLEETMTKKIVLLVAIVWCLGRPGMVAAQTPTPEAPPASAPTAAAPAAPTAVAITDAELKAAVKPTDRAKGDPDGALTGT